MSSSIDPRSCRVALLCGGKSNEREISLASGKGAREALETAGFSVTDIDPANREDLKRLIEEPFDVAFLCLHGKYGEDGTVQGLLDIVGIPYTCSDNARAEFWVVSRATRCSSSARRPNARAKFWAVS